jgi:hypothetical protein
MPRAVEIDPASYRSSAAAPNRSTRRGASSSGCSRTAREQLVGVGHGPASLARVRGHAHALDVNRGRAAPRRAGDRRAGVPRLRGGHARQRVRALPAAHVGPGARRARQRRDRDRVRCTDHRMSRSSGSCSSPTVIAPLVAALPVLVGVIRRRPLEFPAWLQRGSRVLLPAALAAVIALAIQPLFGRSVLIELATWLLRPSERCSAARGRACRHVVDRPIPEQRHPDDQRLARPVTAGPPAASR